MKAFLGCLGCVLLPLLLLILLIAGLIGVLVAGSNINNGKSNGQVVENALAMAAHLHNGGLDGYDVVMDSGFPSGALSYWDSVCGSGCGWQQNGNLQCGVFVGMAYGWSGLPLLDVNAVIDWWNTVYANNRQPGWIEIPNGTGAPAPGDILILDSPYFDGVGHAGIVIALMANSLTFAESNGPAPLVTWSLDANGALLAGWANYTVKGFIRHLPSS